LSKNERFAIQNMEHTTITREDLIQFFEDRPSLSREGIAREAGISGKQLQLIISGERKLTDKSIGKLFPVLKLYGYKKY
jgi:plasmid maintenance system antidote protein VapI